MEGATGYIDQRGTIAHMKCKEHHETGRETWENQLGSLDCGAGMTGLCGKRQAS